MRICLPGPGEPNSLSRILNLIVWFLAGLGFVTLLPKLSSDLALNLARVQATPIWMGTDSKGIFEPNVDMRSINTWLAIALRLDPGNQRALVLELERDLYVNGYSNRPDNPSVQAILAGLRASSFAGLSSNQENIPSASPSLSWYAVTRYWWSLAREQLSAAEWNEAVESYQMGFLAKAGPEPKTIQNEYYLALGHQVSNMGNSIGEDKARFLASKYYWLAGEVKMAVEQGNKLLSSPTVSTNYRSWAWYLVGIKDEAAIEPAEALDAYSKAVELDGGQILAVLAMKRLAAEFARNDLLATANDALRKIAENIDLDGGLAIKVPDGSSSMGLRFDEDLNGSTFNVPGVLVWKPSQNVVPAGNNWVQAGTYWIQAGNFTNIATNPGFEWMAAPQGRDSLPGYQRNNRKPCRCEETPDPLGIQGGQVAEIHIDEQDRNIMIVSKSILGVQPDEVYAVSVDGRAQGGINAGNWVVGEFGVLWYDSARNSTSYKILGDIRSDLDGIGWIHREGIVRVPAGITGFQIVFWNFIPANSTNAGTIYWDNLSFVRMTPATDPSGSNWR